MKPIEVTKKQDIEKAKQQAEKQAENRRSLTVKYMFELIKEFPDKAEKFIKEGKHRTMINNN